MTVSQRLAAILGLWTLALAPSVGAVVEQPGLVGRWLTQDEDAIVEFAPCAAPAASPAICGRIVELEDPEAGDLRDSKSPRAEDRDRPILGLEIIHGLREAGPGLWEKGHLYNPDDGHTYSGAVRVQGDKLSLKGCAMAILCRTQKWRRIRP